MRGRRRETSRGGAGRTHLGITHYGQREGGTVHP